MALNDEIVALFAGMEARRERRARREGGRTRPDAAGTPRKADVVLPPQEDEASRMALGEREAARERRAALYGTHVGEVRALEAVVNALFDRAVRDHNPPLWPTVPLR